MLRHFSLQVHLCEKHNQLHVRVRALACVRACVSACVCA